MTCCPVWSRVGHTGPACARWDVPLSTVLNPTVLNPTVLPVQFWDVPLSTVRLWCSELVLCAGSKYDNVACVSGGETHTG